MLFNEYMYVLSSCSQLEGPCQHLYRLGEQGLCQWEKITDMEELTVKVVLYSCRRGAEEEEEEEEEKEEEEEEEKEEEEEME